MTLIKDVQTVLIVHLWWNLYTKRYSCKRAYFDLKTQVLYPILTRSYKPWQTLTKYLMDDEEKRLLFLAMLARKFRQENERFITHVFEKMYQAIKILCRAGHDKKVIFELLHDKRLENWGFQDQGRIKREEPLLYELGQAFEQAGADFRFNEELDFQSMFEYGEPEFVIEARKYAEINRDPKEVVWRLQKRCLPSYAETSGEIPQRIYEF